MIINYHQINKQKFLEKYHNYDKEILNLMLDGYTTPKNQKKAFLINDNTFNIYDTEFIKEKNLIRNIKNYSDCYIKFLSMIIDNEKVDKKLTYENLPYWFFYFNYIKKT